MLSALPLIGGKSYNKRKILYKGTTLLSQHEEGRLSSSSNSPASGRLSHSANEKSYSELPSYCNGFFC